MRGYLRLTMEVETLYDLGSFDRAIPVGDRFFPRAWSLTLTRFVSLCWQPDGRETAERLLCFSLPLGRGYSVHRFCVNVRSSPTPKQMRKKQG